MCVMIILIYFFFGNYFYDYFNCIIVKFRYIDVKLFLFFYVKLRWEENLYINLWCRRGSRFKCKIKIKAVVNILWFWVWNLLFICFCCFKLYINLNKSCLFFIRYMWYVMFNYEFDLKLYVVKFVYLRVFILY